TPWGDPSVPPEGLTQDERLNLARFSALLEITADLRQKRRHERCFDSCREASDATCTERWAAQENVCPGTFPQAGLQRSTAVAPDSSRDFCERRRIKIKRASC